MIVIGIAGKMGTGKTTVSNHLIDSLPGNWKKLAFGDLLKEEVSEIYGVPKPWTYEHKDYLFTMPLECNPPKERMMIREILQWHGTEVRRAQDPHYWVEKLADKILDHRELDGVVIDDARFPDEANLVLEFKEHLLIRLGVYRGWKCGVKIARHSSETALDGYLKFDRHLYPSFGKLEGAADLIVRDIEAKFLETV